MFSQNAGTPESHGFAKAGHEKEKSPYDNVIGSEIDYIVKKHADRLMDAMEGISSKLLQLDNRTHHLENSLAEVKMAIANNNGSTDGRLSQLENILREVFLFIVIFYLFAHLSCESSVYFNFLSFNFSHTVSLPSCIM